MNTINISPSVLALKDNPESWDNRILELPIALSGVHFDI